MNIENTHNDPHRPNDDKDLLRQQLLELHYDLLGDPEASQLRAAIEQDPEVAAEWAATLRLAGKMADAAKFEGAQLPKVNLVAVAGEPSSNGSSAASDDPVIGRLMRSDDAASGGQSHQIARGRRNWFAMSTMLAATAAAIGMLVIGSWYQQRLPETPLADVRIQAQPVASENASSNNVFRMVTRRVDSSSVAGRFPVTPASLSFSVLARNTVLFSGTTETDDRGNGRISLPRDLIIPKESTLQVTARSADGSHSQRSIEIPLEPTRCLTYVVVDRPVYRPGETVFFRSLTLQRRSLAAGVEVPIRFELVDPSGAIVPGAFTEGITDRGVGNGSFTIPSTAPGGPYTLVAKSLDDFFPEERCEFQVRAYRVPRFKKELEFRRRSYGPGETVQADFSAVRAEGGAVAGANVRITATVDDQVVYQDTTTTAADGTCLVSFQLPSLIREGAGQLSLSIDDGATQETKSKTIPIQLGRVSVDFYPEGGYLVAGLTNRVYFAARDTLGNPIEIAGEVQSRNGQSVAKIETTRDGMGRFEFIPDHGDTYTLKVTQPIDVSNSPRLPSVVKNLPVIDTGQGVYDPAEPITMVIRSSKKTNCLVRAVCRGQLAGQSMVELREGENSVSLPIRKDAAGVIRVTVLDDAVQPAQPLVERLVYRRVDKKLDVEIIDAPSALERSPGEPLRLTLQVRDEAGKPVPAVLGVSVVDDAALSLQDQERPGLRTHFLLTSEVEKPEDLEHANFYLSDQPEAAESLDLLLGTQGWRRFVYGSEEQGPADFREQLIRLLELDGNAVAEAGQRFDSGGAHAGVWMQYSAAAHGAWHRLLYETKLLVLVVLGLWLLSVILHLRKNLQPNLAVWLLVTSTSMLIYGCSSSVSTATVDASREESTGSNADMDYEMAMADESAAGFVSPEPTVQPDPTDTVSEAEESDQGPGATSDSAGQTAPPAEQRRPSSEDLSEAFWVEDDKARSGMFATGRAAAGRSISGDDLQRLLAARGLDAEALADELLRELRFPVRQYAHRYTPSQTGVRQDFTETLYWQPMLITDSQGRANIRFDLADSVTTFRVHVDGHTTDGRIGSGGGEVTARLPFQIEPKLPLEVTAGDRIELPIAVINATDQQTDVQLSVRTDDSLSIVGDTTRALRVPASGRQREHVSIDVVGGSAERDAAIEVRGTGSGRHSDSILRRVHVAPSGYPARRSIAGRLDRRAKLSLPIPDDLVPGSLVVTVRAYPSPLADVMSGVESILREPHGCFEQTSATNYPNTMALLYLEESQTANPQVSRKALGMLDRGYEKLISFECQQRGYEWFGDDPGHEALSAFGLLQFTDMSKVMGVSQEMIDRTRVWLLGRRDGQGGFRRNPRQLHVWSVQQQVVNAYVLWAVTEADVSAGHPRRAAGELAPELDQLARVADNSRDPYLIALSAATLINVQRNDEGDALLQRLAELQQEDGSLQGATTVTSSGGLSRTMETTALAALAWVKRPSFVPRARAATGWITANRVGNGGFGSTQATVLALKALVAMADHSQMQGGGVLEVRLGGQVIGQTNLPDQPQSGSTVEITGLGSVLEEEQVENGRVEIELVGQGAANLSYTVDVHGHVMTPDSHPDCPFDLETRLIAAASEQGDIRAGDLIKVEAQLTNRSGVGQPMTVAVVGLPGGVEPRTEELDEAKQQGRFDFYEIRGREVVFYWRTIEPDAVKPIDFHVTATVGGSYTGPASRAYLYYTAEQKRWIEPLKVEVGVMTNVQ